MNVSVKYLIGLIFVLTFSELAAQNLSLRIISSDNAKATHKLNYSKNFANKNNALKEVASVVKSLQYQGYLLASVDSIKTDSFTVSAFIKTGEPFKIAFLKLGNLNPSLASKLGISEKLFLNKAFRYREVAKSIEKIISYYENIGFPFASVKLDSVNITGSNLSAVFDVQKNRFFKIDSIKIVGTAKINANFLRRYLGVKENMPYNESILANLSPKIKQLPFLIETQAQRVQLTERTNKLLLFLDKKEASQFDGIIGLLPDVNTGKTVVTGDVKLKLVNGILRNGETFDLEWRRLQTQTQDFNGRIIYPFLFGTPFGTDYAIKIYRKDSTFIDINNNIGLQYYFSGLNNLKIFYKQRNSNLISTAGLDFATSLPDYADVTTQAYGLGIFLEKLDYRFNPHKGFLINVTGQTGNRLIRKNPAVNPFVYENMILRSTQYQFESTSALFIQLFRNNVLKIGVQAASVFGSSTIFTNELFRIGGLKTLRGFDEESIFASTYVIPTIEYRFLFARNSNILLFAEGAWYENNSNRRYVSDMPISVGAGVNFDTKAGILSINYGLGNQFAQGFDLRNGKIHFGLTALF